MDVPNDLCHMRVQPAPPAEALGLEVLGQELDLLHALPPPRDDVGALVGYHADGLEQPLGQRWGCFHWVNGLLHILEVLLWATPCWYHHLCYCSPWLLSRCYGPGQALRAPPARGLGQEEAALDEGPVVLVLAPFGLLDLGLCWALSLGCGAAGGSGC